MLSAKLMAFVCDFSQALCFRTRSCHTNEMLYDAACIYAVAIAVVKDDVKLSDHYAGRAVILLKRLHSTGYFIAEAISSGKSWSEACGSPRSIANKMRATPRGLTQKSCRTL